MISYILLVGVVAVGVAGLVVSILAARTAFRAHRAERHRAHARAELVAGAVRQREERRTAELARSAPTVDGLTHVIEKLEESVRFARVPVGPPVPRPSRTASGTQAPPLPPQCYPAVAASRAMPPPIPPPRPRKS